MRTDNFAGRLKELRIAAGLTQKELAERAGMALGGVFKLEQGVNKPSWESVVLLADALGVDCRAFLEAPTSVPEPKRGRPPKVSAEPVADKAPKRPRGRPRKGT